jgi:hypothetical protein
MISEAAGRWLRGAPWRSHKVGRQAQSRWQTQRSTELGRRGSRLSSRCRMAVAHRALHPEEHRPHRALRLPPLVACLLFGAQQVARCLQKLCDSYEPCLLVKELRQ